MSNGYVLVTSRQDIGTHQEVHDSLDIRWYRIFSKLGIQPFIVPSFQVNYFNDLIGDGVRGIILTGGNDIGTVPLRDEIEFRLIDMAVRKDLPVIGFCRGMQIINEFYGGSYFKIGGHVATQHGITCTKSDWTLPKTVNSFHNFGINFSTLGKNLEILAHADDNTVEALCHQSAKVYGFMWHPERCDEITQPDLFNLSRLLET
ncbi:gamma-glutamyl-gamma-aminobutyrate hydrolase family protein [Planktomarina sp.]|nr:gamma-glutamyl-gamma-aminobutyrate hydrolase family protein [Planktomarina sp.]